jgi:hypothetical protein
MSGHVQQNIFPHVGREIDRLWTLQFRVQRKSRHLDIEHEFFQARNAAQLDRLLKRTISPKRARRNTDVEIIVQRTSTADSIGLQIREQAIFFSLKVQTFGWNLF